MMIDADLKHRLQDLVKAFLNENANINLSALRTEDACWHGNILDSLALADAVEAKLIPPPHMLMDIGTGGGFPLLPLAMLYPDATCTGVDSIGKKVLAVGRIVAKCNVKNARVIAERSESLVRTPAHREKYDTVTARAVAPLNILLEYTTPFARIGGHVVLWKSLQIDEELAAATNAATVLGCTLADRFTYDLGGDWGTRQLLIYRKVSKTPKIYPRAVGEAKAKPL
jgi:16S rRNA (guanine527-N7)-methyltransferase